ncbi:MAG: bifunctional nuclease family protein [Anaerolineales bacterium]|nr:bifunctional nuclease family protein [Anaerolineales bacterium]
MIEMIIDSVRISLMTQNRVVVLREKGTQRYLPIWIGAPEADAITLRLQGISVERPLTHDLLAKTLHALGAEVQYVLVSDLRSDIFYAQIVLEYNERELAIDARPSDAIALAVRAEVPVYVNEKVLSEAGRLPDEDVTPVLLGELAAEAFAEEGDEDLGAFADFIEELDLDDLGGN